MKTGIFIVGILSIIFICFGQSQAYQINILEEGYLCEASASAWTDFIITDPPIWTNSSPGTYYASASMLSYYSGTGTRAAEAYAMASITKNNNQWNLTYSATIYGMNYPLNGADCSSSAKGEISFYITKEAQDIENSVPINLQWLLDGRYNETTSGPPYYNIKINEKAYSNWLDWKEIYYSFEANVNEIQTLSVAIWGDDFGVSNPGYYAEQAELKLSVLHSSIVPIPSAVLLLGVGLGHLVLYRRRKQTAKN
jgi:hypothetical protein